MLSSLFSLLPLTLYGAAVKATNLAGDPTDLANYPPCAVRIVLLYQ